MFKLLKKWLKDYNATQKEMQDAGIILPPTWIGIGSYYDPSLSAYINTHDDRSNAVSTDHRHSKKPRQV
mgnify:CR=1 FL=1|jgi:hypothetical protein